MGNINHDTEAHPESSHTFEPIPPGRYKAQVTNSEVKPTSKGDGTLLKLTFEILEDKYNGRLVFNQLNILNPSEMAQKIARGELTALCKACGLTGIVEDSTDLHERPLQIKVGIESKAGYEPRNVIKGYYPLDSVPRQAPTSNGAEDDLPDFLK